MKNRENFAPLIFVLSALIVMGIGFLTRSSLPVPSEVGKALGMAIFLVGMAIFIWTVIYLRGAFRGTVAPVSDRLVQNGPYRGVRHPLYLSMIITLLGIGMAFRSLWGMFGVFMLFVPAVVYRARLEERALAEKFGGVWDDYVDHTFFLIPLLW